MGFLNFSRTGNNSAAPDISLKTSHPVSLTKNDALNKKISLRKEIILDEVKKNNIQAATARVVFVLDHSGSMRNMYKDGTVQDLLEKIFPMAMCFDDNAELEFYWFDSTFKELEPVTYANLDGYVQKIILSQQDHFGGTCYAPIMNQILKRYGKKNKAYIPTFVIFITDGANSDKAKSKEILTEASKYNIFWKFLGIGKEQFPFLEKLDTLTGRYIDNANFACVNDISSISDNQLYSLLLDEYNDWLNLCRTHNIPVGF
ncbi:MAG: VWA domain-containing protein [Clostridia bacterium]|nr:VWA domain-containing protein [Clostridia bacterium]